MIALHKHNIYDSLTYILCKTSCTASKHYLYASAKFPFRLLHCAYLCSLTFKFCTSTSVIHLQFDILYHFSLLVNIFYCQIFFIIKFFYRYRYLTSKLCYIYLTLSKNSKKATYLGNS